ncbi:toprim domain-containing protein [Mycoplasma tauri]|uniref:toprim domain-containing protein n=1 Tax=Mycoplasma tauri TaxID=547987 RepID=UPI001CBF9240|nr:toprim domain-containing protein [Mycoplasma tauri]MBZ4218013.1 toprim domain-containing protein [Mycoplasma tauri]
MKIKSIDEMSEILRTLPGVTKKHSEKISNFFISESLSDIESFLFKLKTIKEKISFCKKCNFIAENEKCCNCGRPNLWNILMVVENAQNVIKIDNLDFFNGYFYVLPYLLSTSSKAKQNDYKYPELIKFAKEKNITEAIIVLSPTLEGEMTVAQLTQLFKENNIKSTRAAIGLPMNSNIEYIDGFTIKQAIENRTK